MDDLRISISFRKKGKHIRWGDELKTEEFADVKELKQEVLRVIEETLEQIEREDEEGEE